MLLAVEGGGFFSSSASGYSKGLTLLLSGRSNQDHTPMRVSPWNQFHLLDQHDPDLPLAPKKKIRRSRGCAAFFCFGRGSIDGPSPPKVGPARQLDGLPDHPTAGSGLCLASTDGDEEGGRKVCLKSSLKKSGDGSVVVVDGGGDSQGEATEEGGEDATRRAERRKVRWTDACGSELVEIREFEVSEAGASDEESDGDGDRGCSCWIQ